MSNNIIQENYIYIDEPQNNGFCIERLDDTNDNESLKLYFCFKCGCLAFRPYSCRNDDCLKIYCLPCKDSINSCNYCKGNLFRPLNERERPNYEKIKVKCIHFDRGCFKTVFLGNNSVNNFETHQNENCEFRNYLCKWCQSKILCRDANKHIEICEKIVINCLQYNSEVRKEKLANHNCIRDLAAKHQYQSEIIDKLLLEFNQTKYELKLYTNLNLKGQGLRDSNFNRIGVNGYLNLGIQHNININTLLIDGFKLIYDKPYNEKTCINDITTALSSYHTNSVVCVGGNKKGESQLRLGAYGISDQVFQETMDLRRAVKKGEVYWYYVRNSSFGFSDTQHIELDLVDLHDINSNFRMSWYIDNQYAGWRLGDIVDLHNSSDYEKKIFILDV